MPLSREPDVGQSDGSGFRTIDGHGSSAEVNEAIFPIVSQQSDGTFIPIGTGFFIAEHGIFVTASHVVEAVLDKKGNATAPFGIFQFLPNNHVVVRPINRVTRHEVADIAVGVASPMTHNTTGRLLGNPLLTLSKSLLGVGSHVFTYAYPKTRVEWIKRQEVSFSPGFYEGNVIAHHPHGRDRVVLPGPCFETSIVIHGGASGGPVLNRSGRVVAVNSTGFDNEPLSFVSCISSLMSLAVHDLMLPGDSSPHSATVGELCAAGFVLCLD